jgi:predicted RNA binding protein YcfA (HicA-like mRNA interferase family)
MELPQISGLKLIKVLTKLGFSVTRQRGSHVRLEKGAGNETIKLTIPLHDKLKKGTLLSIIKASKISQEDFENLL